MEPSEMGSPVGVVAPQPPSLASQSSEMSPQVKLMDSSWSPFVEPSETGLPVGVVAPQPQEVGDELDNMDRTSSEFGAQIDLASKVKRTRKSLIRIRLGRARNRMAAERALRLGMDVE